MVGLVVGTTDGTKNGLEDSGGRRVVGEAEISRPPPRIGAGESTVGRALFIGILIFTGLLVDRGPVTVGFEIGLRAGTVGPLSGKVVGRTLGAPGDTGGAEESDPERILELGIAGGIAVKRVGSSSWMASRFCPPVTGNDTGSMLLFVLSASKSGSNNS